MQMLRWMLGAVAVGCLAGACGGNAEQAAPGGAADGPSGVGTGNGGSAGNAGSTGNGAPSTEVPSGGGNAPSRGTTPDVTTPDVTTPAVSRVPLKHRAAAQACDHERPPGSVSRLYDVAVPDDAQLCTTDADCTVSPQCTDCRAACVDIGETKVCLTSSFNSCVLDAQCTEGENGRCEDLRGAVCTYDECFTDAECNQGGPCACEGGFWSDSNACVLGNCQTDADCGGGYCSPSFGGCGDYSGVVGYYCHVPEDTCVDDSECTENGPGYCMYRPEVSHWACGYGSCVG